MNRDETVKDMAKILCPKGTANCEKCSKNYKCDVKFSQLAQLVDGGCQIVGEDEIVIKADIKCVDSTTAVNVIEFFAKHNAKVRQETVREVLQALFSKEDMSTDTTLDLDENGKWVKHIINYFTIYEDEVKDLANKYGIEMEE